MRRLVVQVLLPLVVLVAAGLAARAMIRSSVTAESKPPPETVPLVEVVEAESYDGPAYVVGTGAIEAERQASLSPEVSGRVLEVDEHLVEGGRVKQGESLLRIDDRRYRLTVKQQRAQVQRAQLEVEMERSAGDAARREWEVSGSEPPSDARRIALRAPQLELAQANVDVMRASLESAQIDVARTSLRAPFNATVTLKSVARGDWVAPGVVVARLIGTDRFLARVSVPIEQLALLQRSLGEHAYGAKAVVTARLDDATSVVREGTVLQIASELDRESRTAQVLVGIERPLDPADGGLPLYVGAFVDVRIEGRTLAGAVTLPRSSLSEGNRVWVVDDESRLRRRTLVIVFGADDRVIASSGVEPGERVVVTTLSEPIEGMHVRLAEDGGA